MRAAVLLAVTLCATACVGLQPRADWDHDTDFAPLRSFALLPVSESEKPPEDRPVSPYVSAIAIARAQRAAASVLVERGYLETERSRADFWVSAHVATQEKLDVYTTGYATGWRGRWADGRTVATTYTEGTLIIDIIAARDQRLVWRGWVSQPVSGSGPGPERVREIVAAILGLFPPARPDSAGD